MINYKKGFRIFAVVVFFYLFVGLLLGQLGFLGDHTFLEEWEISKGDVFLVWFLYGLGPLWLGAWMGIVPFLIGGIASILYFVFVVWVSIKIEKKVFGDQ